ncbi:MAG: GDSL-like Lipase/Acylhydrolase [Thermoleophilia bacterium]|nr:GDSL-like Lipase/Acylhydrolase [Thermoleophilia bacterium]
MLCALAVAGCGAQRGDGAPADVRPDPDAVRGGSIAAVPSDRVIATLGDSIVAGSPLWDPDPATRKGFEQVDERSQWQRSVRARGGATLRNCGVWGERTDEIAARYEACTKGADAVVIQGGINDIVQGRDIDEAAHDLACLAERARGDGLQVALADVLPWNNGYPTSAQPIRDLNAKVHALAKRGGVPVLPFFATLDDPAHPDRMPKDRTDDGNHPDVTGYAMLGATAWREPRTPTGAFADDCD